jgi:hypothetical protein
VKKRLEAMAYEDKYGKLFPKVLETHNKDIGEIKRGIAGFG